MASEQVSYIVAFVAGVLTFLSPCLFPLIPSFVAFIAGVSLQDLAGDEARRSARRKVIIHTLLFIAGFSLVFILLGLTASAIGKTLFHYQKAIRIVGGALVTFLGLYLAGVIKLDFLSAERRFAVPMRGARYVSSFLMGVTFAAAWTPCAGPILGSILVLAGTKSQLGTGVILLASYSLGIAVPFFITALVLGSVMNYFNKAQRIVTIITKVSGVFLVIVGILIMTNYLAIIGERLLSAVTQ